MVYKFFDKKAKGTGAIKNDIKENQQLANKLHKPIIRKFKKEKCTLLPLTHDSCIKKCVL